MDEKIVCFVLRRQIQNCYYSSDTTRIPPIKYDVEVRVEKKFFPRKFAYYNLVILADKSRSKTN